MFPYEFCEISKNTFFTERLQATASESLSIEKRIISQSKYQERFEQRKYRITSSNAHKVLIRQQNFETLTENLLVKNKKCSSITPEALNHGEKFEHIARQIYIDVMKFKL